MMAGDICSTTGIQLMVPCR